jgi:hypothetical protein
VIEIWVEVNVKKSLWAPVPSFETDLKKSLWAPVPSFEIDLKTSMSPARTPPRIKIICGYYFSER